MTENQKALITEANELNNHPALQDHDHTSIIGMMLQCPDATERIREHVEDLRQRTQESGL